MASYEFFKMVAIESEIYFRVGVLRRHIHFFKMAAGSHIGFDLVNIRPHMKRNCCSAVGPQIWS